MKRLRVLVVDDSASGRKTLRELLFAMPEVEVVGSAADGDEALRKCGELKPDLVTLDLEMPRMDGFTFLRLLMARRPTKVVVISSQSGRDAVFRALELGALDFIAKPEDAGGSETPSAAGIEGLKAQLDRVIEIALALERAGSGVRASSPGIARPATPTRPLKLPTGMPKRVIAVAASTGGPRALMDLFSALPTMGSGALVVAQHMPERFTRSFAERLHRHGSFEVREAETDIELRPHTALVCPGGRCLEIERRGERLLARVRRPTEEDRYAPSADRLFSSVARAVGGRAVAVVLTGMGDDAAKGVVEVKKHGGLVLCEAEETAVVFGMPRAAALTGCADEVLPLHELVAKVRGLVAS